MNNKAINELAFVGYEELGRSWRVLSTLARENSRYFVMLPPAWFPRESKTK